MKIIYYAFRVSDFNITLLIWLYIPTQSIQIITYLPRTRAHTVNYK
jgi:hypothetical protein